MDVLDHVKIRAAAMGAWDYLSGLTKERFPTPEKLSALFAEEEDPPLQVTDIIPPQSPAEVADWNYWQINTVGERCQSQQRRLDSLLSQAELYGYFRHKFAGLSLPIARPALSLFHDMAIMKLPSPYSGCVTKVNGFNWTNGHIDLHLPAYLANHRFTQPVILQAKDPSPESLWEQISLSLTMQGELCFLSCTLEPSFPSSLGSVATYLYPLGLIQPSLGATLAIAIHGKNAITLTPILRMVEVNPKDFHGVGPQDSFVRIKLHESASRLETSNTN